MKSAIGPSRYTIDRDLSAQGRLAGANTKQALAERFGSSYLTLSEF